MKNRELTDEELIELDNYLQDESNKDIYFEIKNTNYNEHFEPLPFLRLFHEKIAFVNENKSKPTFVINTLKNLDYSDYQKAILLGYLGYYFSDEIDNDPNIRIICRIIDDLETFEDLNKSDEEAKSEFDFKRVRKHIDTLSNRKEKIAYLIKVKTKYEQVFTDGNIERTGFDEKCDLEILKLNRLSQLETPKELKFVEVAKHKDLTIDRVIFLLNSLIPNFAECDATNKARLINFLTGFDYETTRQRFSSIYRKDADKHDAFKKDMEIVLKYIDLLGLSEISSQIKKDLDFR